MDRLREQGTGIMEEPTAVLPAAGRRGRLLPLAGWTLLIVAPLLIVTVQLLQRYLGGVTALPYGADTPDYIWRANVVHEDGLDALAASRTSTFRGDNADRPGYPVLAAVIRAATGIASFDLTFVLPAAAAGLIGLAAGAFAVRVLHEPPWAFPVYAVVVGASVNVGLTAPGLIDNLVVDPVLLAAATTCVLAAGGERTRGATLVLFAGAAAIHWPFALTFLAILAALAAGLLPGSLRIRQQGSPLLATPAGRLGTLLLGSAFLIAAIVAVAPGPPESPGISPQIMMRKLRIRLPWYRLPIVLPAAALGALALMVPKDAARRRGLLLALIWTGTAAAGVALLFVGVSSPAHRLLGFALGLPILVAAAIVAGARLIARAHPLALPLAVIFVAAALIGGASFLREAHTREGRVSRDRTRAETRLIQTRLAGQYLERVGNRSPVVFVANPSPGDSPILSFRRIRSGLPGSQAWRAYVYVGDPANVISGRPTVRPGKENFNEASLRYWTDIEPLLEQDPIVLLLPAFNRSLPHEEVLRAGKLVAPGLIVVRGPAPAGWEADPDPPKPPSVGALTGRLTAVLLLLFVAGLGWAASLLPFGWPHRVALAPSFGIAVLSLGGVLVGRLWPVGVSRFGLPLAALVAAVGWVPVIARRILQARRPPDSPGSSGG